jgi:ketosteroid isomerase-like protein
MGDPRTTEELIDLIREGVLFGGGTALHGLEGIETMAILLTETGHPDFVTVMVGIEGIETEYPGVDGFREALSDWITPYERFRLEIDEVVVKDDRVVFLVRQVGTTKHGDVEIETPSGSVFEIEDGQIRRATFYIDQRLAREAGGID